LELISLLLSRVRDSKGLGPRECLAPPEEKPVASPLSFLIHPAKPGDGPMRKFPHGYPDQIPGTGIRNRKNKSGLIYLFP
jgi:hypothetical protein